jgi:hypothetical protein
LSAPLAGPAPQTEATREWSLLARTDAPRELERSGEPDIDPTLDADDSGADDVDPQRTGAAGDGHSRLGARPSRKRSVAVDDVQLTAAAVRTRVNGGGSKGRPLAERRLQRGSVTYLRCDGAARRNKSATHCPRDRRLEAGVWKALKDLPQCRVADPGSGRAQLKLTMKRQAAPLIEVAGPDAGSGLNLRAVNKCAAPDLVRLKTRLRASHAVITFAFGLN